MTSEFEIIQKYFSRHANDVLLGVGDDGAVVQAVNDRDLVVTSDTLISGTHFSPDVNPFTIGYKSVAVNLSDLAAMGAVPKYITLSITLPSVEETWVREFSKGIYSILDDHATTLIGGDTTRGDTLSITVTALGYVKSHMALRRDGACLGDDVWVSGFIGLGALGLLIQQGSLNYEDEYERVFLGRLHQPEPRIKLGQRLLGVANAAIDVSDGLIADAGHIAERSGVQIKIEYEDIPVHSAVTDTRSNKSIENCILGGGDDYELLFTARKEREADIIKIGSDLKLPLTKIGKVSEGTGVVVTGDGAVKKGFQRGFDHFSKN